MKLHFSFSLMYPTVGFLQQTTCVDDNDY
uniref:Uncharacterized protein n=1 Tax=Rhizophora mucronata TaxID=61149 RepID=A0A2P2P434_RHIMU